METTDETAGKPKRRGGWPKGKPRKPPVEAQAPEAPLTEAPIHVRLRLKDYPADISFGCGRRLVENGFHVFIGPAKDNPYWETRREYAISQIVELEITEAPKVYDYTPQMPAVVQPSYVGTTTTTDRGTATPTAPVIHSAKKWAIERMAERDGTARVDAIPGITFGESAG